MVPLNLGPDDGAAWSGYGERGSARRGDDGWGVATDCGSVGKHAGVCQNSGLGDDGDAVSRPFEEADTRELGRRDINGFRSVPTGLRLWRLWGNGVAARHVVVTAAVVLVVAALGFSLHAGIRVAEDRGMWGRTSGAIDEQTAAIIGDGASEAAEELMRWILDSPVADHVDLTGLERAVAANDAELTRTLTGQVERAYLEAMDQQVEKIDAALAAVYQRADGLQDAPDTDERRELERIAGQWRRVMIARANLPMALEAEQRLRELADVVESQRSQALEREREEAERQQAEELAEAVTPETWQYAPAQSKPAQSTPVAPAAPASPRPNWRVPGESSDLRLPGRDGSL